MPDDAAPNASASVRPTVSASDPPPGDDPLGEPVPTLEGEEGQGSVQAPPAYAWYSYAIIRVVPRVDRGECVNVGVVLFARARRHLAARIDLASARTKLLALDPRLDLGLVERHLSTFLAICGGDAAGGPLADLPAPERFHWLTAPRSTIIQTSPTHVGRATDLSAELGRLLDAYVRPLSA
ncbi:MAG: DUF3037 domain-containing protein [Chloroflexi bacterium]|nr:DUF3037 domain-containing protein [Chloroflexota bacterium]